MTLWEYISRVYHQIDPCPSEFSDLRIIKELKDAILDKDLEAEILNIMWEACDQLTSINIAERAVLEVLKLKKENPHHLKPPPAKKGARAN